MMALFFGACTLWACNDRTRETPPVTFEPPPPDLGSDVFDFGPEPQPDEYCAGELDGASCELPGARGVCFREECVLVACENGFGDCGSRIGCETDLTTVQNCGGCDAVCEETQRCVPGPKAFVCSAGIACPVDRFDLDSDPANGCEWASTWEAPLIIAPPDMAIDAAAWGIDAPILAGGVDELRISVALGAAPQTTIWPEPRGQARAIDVALDDAFERVVWTDGVSLRRKSDQMQWFLTPDCAEPAAARRFVGADGEWVATQYEVFRVDTACGAGACLEPVFSLADYQDSWSADFAPAETSQCDSCALALPAQCWGPEQCRSVDFDETVCAGCVPGVCPPLDIVDVVATGTTFTVVTARGVLRPGQDAARNESKFDPTTAGGPRFVSGVGIPGRLTLAHSTGFFRVLDDTLMPSIPDFGVNFDPEAAAIVGEGDLVVAVADGEVRLIRPSPLSARTVLPGLETAPGIQGLSARLPMLTPDGVRVLYVAAGQAYLRLFQRD